MTQNFRKNRVHQNLEPQGRQDHLILKGHTAQELTGDLVLTLEHPQIILDQDQILQEVQENLANLEVLRVLTWILKSQKVPKVNH